MGKHDLTITSTADLEADGALGYAKSIAAFVGGVIAIVLQYIAEGQVRTVLTIIVAVLTFASVYQFPNKVKEVVPAVPPTPVQNPNLDN